MAEETKMDGEEETVDIAKTVDSIIAEKSEDTTSKDAGGQPEKTQGDEKTAGWLTSLPKELRDGVDVSKYASLADYIKDLRANQKVEETPATKEETEKEWTQLFTDALPKEASEDDRTTLEAIINSLKTDGVSSKDARKTLTAYGNEIQKLAKKRSDEKTARFESYIKDNWGDNSSQYFKDSERGLKVIADENVELLKSAKASGLTDTPEFIEVCRMLGQRTSESHMAEGSRGSKKSDYDPKNPLRY